MENTPPQPPSTAPKTPAKVTPLLVAMTINLIGLMLEAISVPAFYMDDLEISDETLELIATVFVVFLFMAAGGIVIAIIFWRQDPVVHRRQALITIVAGIIFISVFTAFMVHNLTLTEFITSFMEGVREGH